MAYHDISGKTKEDVLKNFRSIVSEQSSEQTGSQYKPSKDIFNDPERNNRPYSGVDSWRK